MAKGQSKDRWARMSLLCTIIANAHRDPKKSRPFKPADFNPHISKRSNPEAVVVTKGNMSVMKEMFESFKKPKVSLEKI